MSIREISFPSANGRDTIKAWAYTPLGKPRAVIQLIHGFGEHSRRYLHMISKFQAAGFVVYADDHIGHGKTAYDSGTMGDPHSGGYMTYLKDEKALHDIAVKDYPGLPYFVFGHSWGSMLGRAYAALYGDDLKGLMLCGVGIPAVDAAQRVAAEIPDRRTVGGESIMHPGLFRHHRRQAGQRAACSRDDHDAPVRRLGQHLLRAGRDFAVAVEQGAVQIEGRKKDGVR